MFWTTVADDSVGFESQKHARRNGRNLKTIYGGIGSMSSFNTWVGRTSTALDDSSTPNAPPTTETKRRSPHPGDKDNHGLPWGFFPQPIPVPVNTHTHAYGYGFSRVRVRVMGGLTGLTGTRGLRHLNIFKLGGLA